MALERVTLTGATGLIGRRLAQALGERGAEVTVLTRSPERGCAGDPLPGHQLEGFSCCLI